MKSAKIASIVMSVIGVGTGLTFIILGITKQQPVNVPIIISGAVLILLTILFSSLLWFIGSRPIDIDDEDNK